MSSSNVCILPTSYKYVFMQSLRQQFFPNASIEPVSPGVLLDFLTYQQPYSTSHSTACLMVGRHPTRTRLPHNTAANIAPDVRGQIWAKLSKQR